MLRVLISAVLALAAPLAPTAPTPAVGPPARITYTAVPAAQALLFDRALELFTAAGLDLPPIDVVGHGDERSCGGRPGARSHRRGRSRIDLCTSEAGPAVEFLVLHELAHAWDRQSLTDEQRRAFLVQRGLAEWRNDDPERWRERGAEHAAEIVVWGVIDRPVRLARIDRNGCTDLLAGYRVLTGAEPLHGYTDACRVDDP